MTEGAADLALVLPGVREGHVPDLQLPLPSTEVLPQSQPEVLQQSEDQSAAIRHQTETPAEVKIISKKHMRYVCWTTWFPPLVRNITLVKSVSPKPSIFSFLPFLHLSSPLVSFNFFTHMTCSEGIHTGCLKKRGLVFWGLDVLKETK